MKKWTRYLLALVMTVTLVGGGSALAANDSAAVAVQLDGKPLTFTDAVPQVKEQRTFLPFRAVFEAMGAEVSNEGNTITAKRGDKTLTMVIGSPNAVVTENGAETPILMDVAPYVDSATWRTYVPVRFAAQAFDCAVGWDQANYTAIIVDTEKLLTEVKAGKSFTYLEKFLNYSETYSTGLWNMDLDFAGDVTVMGAPLSFDGIAAGVMEGSEKLDVSLNMKLDMMAYMDAMYAQAEAAGQAMEPLTAEEKAQLEQLGKEGIGMAIRADMTKGAMYMNLNGALMEASGMDPKAWYAMDLGTILAQSGMDMNSLKSGDYESLLKLAVGSVELTDATTDYAQLKLLAEKAAQLLSDASFLTKDNVAANGFIYSENGIGVEVTLALTMKNDAVVGYELTAAGSLTDAEAGTMALEMWVSMDEAGRMAAEVWMDLGTTMSLKMSMMGGYTKGTTAPVTEPPAGALIVPFESLITPAAF